MLVERGSVDKGFFALCALELLHAGVGRNVSCQVGVYRECFSTKSTFERSFSSVGPGVSDHVAVVSESFATVVALEGFVSRVCPHVFLQRPWCAEFLSAQLALNTTMVLGDHVLASVSGELSTVRETFVALVAPEVLVRTVRCHVGDHLTTRREHLVTLVALEGLVRISARWGGGSRMLSDVHSQRQR